MAPIGDIFDQSLGQMRWIRGKLAEHVGDYVVSSPEEVVLMTSSGTKSLYSRPPQSLNPSLTMSFAGYFLVHSLLSAFPAYLRTYFRFDWFGPVYLATTAGFVADQLMWDKVFFRFGNQCAECEKQHPNHMYLPLLLTVYCNTIWWLRLHSLCNTILLLPCLMMYYNVSVFAVFQVSLPSD